jgi:hypothetical protein
MRRTTWLIVLVLMVSGCASISVVPLQHDGSPATGKAEGLRYYLPRPYLLVTDLPADAPTSAINDTTASASNDSKGTTETPMPGAHQQSAPGAGQHGGGANTNTPLNSTGPALNTGGSGGTDTGSDKPKSGGDTAAPSSDTSYQATTPHYVLKLIYLPDLEHPMAIRQSSGLFGTSSLKPTLQDGWMLTALDATADTKAAEVLASVASVIGAVKGGGGGSDSGGGKGGGKTQSAPGAGPASTAREAFVLRPGLYSFEYGNDGKLTGLQAITYFGCTGTVGTVPCVGDFAAKEKR